MSDAIRDAQATAEEIPPKRRETAASRLGVIDPLSWQDRPIPERRWVVAGIIPWGNVTLLSGDGGVGKSLLSMQLLTGCATHKPFLGREVTPCKTLGVFCEDDADELHRRQADINRSLGVDFADLENLNLVSRVGHDNVLMEFYGKGSEPGKATRFFHDLAAHAKSFGAQVIVLDTVADLFGGNEIIRAQVRQFINALRRIALDVDGAVILTAHPSVAGMASGSGISGSTAWNNSVRSRLYLTRPKADDDEPDTNDRVLRGMKQNYCALASEIRLRWQDGVFIVQEQPTGIYATIQRRTIERVFLDCLRTLNDQGRPVSHSKAANNFAPGLIAKMPEAEGHKRRDLEAAMERLFAQGAIKVEQYGRGGRYGRIVSNPENGESDV